MSKFVHVATIEGDFPEDVNNKDIDVGYIEDFEGVGGYRIVDRDGNDAGLPLQKTEGEAREAIMLSWDDRNGINVWKYRPVDGTD